MDYNIHLIVHNIFSILSTIALLGMAFFAYIHNPKKIANITWSLLMFSVAVFTVSHVIGVNIADPELSRFVLMFNLSTIFISAFCVHAVMVLAGTPGERKWIPVTMYTLSSLVVLFFIIYPDLFLQPSVPKMYFPNYYEPGALNWIRLIFTHAFNMPLIAFIFMRARRNAKTLEEKGRHTYVAIAMLISYGLSFIPNFLVYDIQIDPLWGMSFSAISVLPFTYGAVRYGLFDIKVIAVRAFYYSVAVILGGGIISLFNYINRIILNNNPHFPSWVTPLVSAVIAVTVGTLVWRSLRESDLLKYQFITTATSKFNNPLLHIKSAADDLVKSDISAEDKMQVEYIRNSNTKLMELTTLLTNVSETETRIRSYHLDRHNLTETVASVTDSLSSQTFSKHITIIKRLKPGMYAHFDDQRIRFVIQTLVENALNYTPSGGTVTVSTYPESGFIMCSVQDNGIGIDPDEMPRLFAKFYRGKHARVADTEGMGIGLFMAKEIVERHHGIIRVESVGRGKGSTFSFSLPMTI